MTRLDEVTEVITRPPHSPRRRPGRGRVVIALILLGVAAMWCYVLYLAIGPGRQHSPDRLADPSFAQAAEARCDQALDEVAALPPASRADSALERAAVIEQANAAFAAMLDDLAEIVPAGDDGELVAAWLADWRTYLGDRERYADTLREDPDAQLLVSAKDGQHVTEYVEQFARDNDMPACSTPIDV